MLSEFYNAYTFSAYHILQCDVKDNRMSIILTVKNVDQTKDKHMLVHTVMGIPVIYLKRLDNYHLFKNLML